MTDEITPTTGVYSGCDLPWEWLDDDAIDLAYEEAYTDRKAELIADVLNNLMPDETPPTDDEIEALIADDLAAEFEYWEGSDRLLYGDWIKTNERGEPDDDGKYAPDPDGEFAAIYNTNECTLQVVFSRHIRYGKPAFLCYPGQVDAAQDDPAEPEGEPGCVVLWDQLKSTERRYVPYYALPITGDSDD